MPVGKESAGVGSLIIGFGCVTCICTTKLDGQTRSETKNHGNTAHNASLTKKPSRGQHR